MASAAASADREDAEERAYDQLLTAKAHVGWVAEVQWVGGGSGDTNAMLLSASNDKSLVLSRFKLPVAGKSNASLSPVVRNDYIYICIYINLGTPWLHYITVFIFNKC